MSNITIIDDDAGLTENLELVLEGAGYSVNVLDRTAGAVGELASHKPDLLILDVMFPDSLCGGFDLAREIRMTPATKDLPIIMLTGVNQEFLMDFSSRDIDDDWMPVQDFIEKPVDFGALMEKIKVMLS